MRSIAFICNYNWVGVSSSVINSAIFWESEGYQVDVYCEKPDIVQFPLPIFTNKRISFIISDIDKKPPFNDISFYNKYFKNNCYDYIVGVDIKGIIRAFVVSLHSQSTIIYHSLEFFEVYKFNIKNIFYKIFEIISATKAKYIFTQDYHRLQFLRRNLIQSKKKFRLVFNSPIGNVIKYKSSYFRDKYNIDNGKKIILAIGSIIKEHYIIELINSVDTWDDQFVLIIHGWFPDDQVKAYVDNKAKKNPNRIFISNYFFKNSDKYIPITACDIGFVGFYPLNSNLLYAAGSAGKLYDFMRCGVPILAYKSPGMAELIEKEEIGICFSVPDEINSALNIILNNKIKFISNCFDAFPKYEFRNQYQKVINSI